MINKLIREYFKIIEYLDKHKCCKRNFTEIVVDKKIIMALLKQDTYLKESEKLRLYKVLNIISADDGHYTKKRVIDRESKRCIVFNQQTYKTLKFFEESIIAYEVMEEK